MHAMAQEVFKASSLQELRKALDDLVEELGRLTSTGRQKEAEALDAEVDWSHLPAFGGERPPAGAEVAWSWSETEVLTGMPGELRIEPRRNQ